MVLLKQEIKKLFDIINLEEDFNSILKSLTELCELPYAFISLTGSEEHIVKAKIGFDLLTIPERILLFNEDIISKNKIIIVTDSDIVKGSEKLDSLHFLFDFFAGFPICTDENVVVGTLCIMDVKPKEISPIELKILKHTVLQIQSLLDLHIQNNKLKKQQKQFELFEDNSKEIFYEVSMDGIISNASDSWTRFLGYELSDVIGKSYAGFIHPEDLNNSTFFLEKLRDGEQKEGEIIYRILHKNGDFMWHTSCVKLLEKDGIQFYKGNCRDINEHIEVQQKLLKQKEFYEKILDRLPTDIAVFDSNYKYIYVNPAAIKNDELRKYIIGKDDFEYAEHTGRDDVFARNRRIKFLKALESRNLIEWEDPIQSQNGEVTFHTRKFTPVFLEDGSLEMMVGFGVDITESKKIQNEILKSRQLTKSIIQNEAVGVLVQGPQFEILENNKAACEMLGLTQDQLIGKTSYDENWKVIRLDGTEFLSDKLPVQEAIKQLKPVKNVVMGVFRPVTNDLVWLLVDAIPVFDDLDVFLYVVCSFNDITAQKNAEDALEISNERFMYSSEATSDALWDWNIGTDEIFVGESYSELFGHRFENNIISGQECENYVHPDDREAYFDNIEKSINGQIYKWSCDYRYLKSDGTYAYVNDKAVIIRNGEGKAIRMIGAMQDITLEKKLKDELQQSEEQFKGVFENSAVGMALVNIEGNYIEVNGRLCEMFGYTSQEMKFLKFQEITFHEDLGIDLDYKEKLDSGKIASFSSEKRFIHKNKSIVWVHMFVSIVKNNKNEIKYYIVQIIDITERKKIEEENKLLIEENNRNKTIQLNEAKNMYRLLADNTIDLVCLHHLDSSFSYVSPSIQKLLGYIPDELTGRFPEEFVHPEDLQALRNSVKGFVSGQEDSVLQIRYRNKEGIYIWFETKAILVIEKDIPISFQSSTRDITQRKKAEEIIENTLIQERELNELRTNLVSTISHEFRTPMTTIRTSAELISMYLESHNFQNAIQINKRVDIITGEIDRIIELMNAVLTISKEESGNANFNPVVIDLKQVCLDIIDSSYRNYDEQRKVKTSFVGDNFFIFADKNLMEYCIFNILNNAFKYSKGFGDIILNVFTVRESVFIEIIDFGIGIPEQDQPKLFKTFFRASNTDGVQGTGLGLYIVKTFAKKNFGSVELESQLGKGTKVTLKFPLKTE